MAIKNKRASHVGFILSFVIFITFLIFLFSIFGSPIKFSSSKDSVVDYLQIELENRLTSNLTIITISPTPTDKNCISIDNQGFDLLGMNVIVKDKDNNVVPSKISGNNLYFKWSGEEYFKLFYAQELQSGNLDNWADCYTLASGDINSYREDYYFDKDKIEKFISDYNLNYTQLKKDLGFPINDEFSLSFTDADGNITQTNQKEAVTDIFSREIPVQYFDETAKINSGFINIRVW